MFLIITVSTCFLFRQILMIRHMPLQVSLCLEISLACITHELCKKKAEIIYIIFTFVSLINKYLRIKSKVFWRWCIIICKSGFSDFVHCLYFNKITFRKLDLLPSSDIKGRTKILAVGPPGWASLRPEVQKTTFTDYTSLRVHPIWFISPQRL
jgi:hypothetical protein